MYNGKSISIAMAAYNGAHYIEEALSGFLTDPLVDQIVVSDDHSTDDTAALIRAIDDPRIKLIENNGPRGQFRNFNNALAYADGDLIQIFSDDDRVLPGFIETQAQAFEADPAIGLVYSSCQKIDEQGNVFGEVDDDGTPLVLDFQTYMGITLKHVFPAPSISAMMISRAVLDAGIRFDPTFSVSGDVEFGNRVAAKFKFARNRSLYLQIRDHVGSVTMNPASPLAYIKEERQTVAFIRDHMPSDAFKRILQERLHTRGTTHGKVLLRMLGTGRWRSFVTAYANLRPVHSPLQCMWLGLRDKASKAGKAS